MVLKDGAKMSKSKGNTVDPAVIDRQLRCRYRAPVQYVCSTAGAVTGVVRLRSGGRQPFPQTPVETGEQAGGSRGSTCPRPAALGERQQAVRRKTHETIAKVSDDFGRRQTFNTAIAALMELCNELGKLDSDNAQDRALADEALRAVALMLCPIVPHVCHALWQSLGGDGDVMNAPWPLVDESALTRDSIEMVVQVNGKVRAKMVVAADADKATVEAQALVQDNVQRFLEGVTIRKVIVVPGKLVNIVAN